MDDIFLHKSFICSSTIELFEDVCFTKPNCFFETFKSNVFLLLVASKFNLTIVFNRYKELNNCDIDNVGGFNDLIQGPHPIAFDRPLTGVTAMTSTQIVTGYTITNTIEDWVTGGTITTEYVEKLNRKWANERNDRLGQLKFYLNGNLIYTEENWEEVIPSYRNDNDLIQSIIDIAE